MMTERMLTIIRVGADAYDDGRKFVMIRVGGDVNSDCLDAYNDPSRRRCLRDGRMPTMIRVRVDANSDCADANNGPSIRGCIRRSERCGC